MIVMCPDAAMEILLGTIRGKAARSLLLQGEQAIAPKSFSASIADESHKLFKQKSVSFEQATFLITSCRRFVDLIELCDRQLDDAANLQMKFNLRAYQAQALLIARERGATIYSFDSETIEACHQLNINCLEEVAI